MVSVCIATFNGEKYIEEQLNSILPQLQPHDEVIISDDGSTDSTLKIVESFNDQRIKVFHHQKKEKVIFRFDYTTHNFEYAITQAKGDYIFLSDQDDVWLPNKVECSLRALENSDLVISDKVVVDENLNILMNTTFNKSKQSAKVWHNIKSPNNPGCCMAFKRCLCDKILPMPKSGVAQDTWIVMLAGIYYKVSYINTPLILFRRHGNNVSCSMGKSNDTIMYRIKYRVYLVLALLKECGILSIIKNW